VTIWRLLVRIDMHLLSALDQASGVVVAQVSVDVKTNEFPDLEGTLVTGDALHAQVGHLNYLHKRCADLVVCVKGNQPTLRKRLKGLPWTDVPVGHNQTGRGHGRIEKRTAKVVTVEAGLGFPHTAQGIQIVRRSRPITPGTAKRAKWRTETVYDEDRSTVRTGNAPRVMATLSSTAISLLRLAGINDIITATRHHARDPSRPAKLLLTC
jgi:predicted transposase YbfD/YdcC